ncbi:MAG: hypothetical protein UW76_C0010G0014 [Parcubacteria group bacterium GW2011_GWF2_44_8b]|nr:MAG: hypothetical protein UV94_C0017G0011 [Parcubacteria group bacterium GW2011_GWC1_43_30]KKT80651.1 MAG: hypothetical protein UW76_C0010G0014 [Parcubacteria group bacterium GW2011_GWF2_44_8b]KKT85125.1 MAG: hypothetical protein UW83_C0028G0009 [Parcubacteria group bacterium GW2011_GWD1_44_9]
MTMGRATIYALVIVPVSFVTAGILVFIAWISGGGRTVATGTVVVVNADVVTLSTRFWVLFVLGVLVLLVWTVINYLSHPAGTPMTQRLGGATPPVWAFAVLLGVTTFHWLFWAIGPGAWNTWLSSQTFWPMNAAIILTVFFASQQGTAARFIGLALWVLFLVVAGIGAYGYFPWSTYWSAATVGSGLRSSSSLSRLPAEVALPIIAGCESGDGSPGSGRQFEADGVTPLRNREGSSAIGKYQIMTSLHEERAKGLGYDIRTEAGNEAYARYLYAESDTLHWEADSRSKACWEPLLARARGTLPSTVTSTHSTVDTTFLVTVRPGQPAEVVMPPNWMIVWWGDKSRFTSRAEWRGQDKVRVFSVRSGVESVEIKIHRYRDPDPNWWRRQ